jgi:hypothetical protein
MDDIAYALEYTAPFRDDTEALKWLGYTTPPDRKHRIEMFAEAYGLPSTEGLVDAVIQRQRLTVQQWQGIVDQGIPMRPNWPSVEQIQQRTNWSERNRSMFE